MPRSFPPRPAADRWAGLLHRHPFLGTLAREGLRRRHARQRSEADDTFDTESALDPHEETVRLAAADGERVYGNGAYAVAIRRGQATQTRGPAGLTLRVAGTSIHLSPGVPQPLPDEWAGDELIGIDVRVRAVRLRG